MKIEHEFTVARRPDQVWDFFQDIPSVAQCLPGADLLGASEDGTYDGKLAVKLGPMSASFEGKATVTPNPEARTAVIEGKGVDRSGGSRGQVKVSYQIVPDGAGSKVGVDADVTLSGPVAQFGRTGLVNEMSKRLIGEFVQCLEAKLAAETHAEAAKVEAGEVRGISLFFASLWGWIRGLFRRGDHK
jgi:carbon monoxide dehydrogenase subunit G